MAGMSDLIVEQQEREISERINKAVAEERQRCAGIAADLASRWEQSAIAYRERYKTRFLWIGSWYLPPAFEQNAQSIEAAATGLRAVETLIAEGAYKQSENKKLSS